MEIQLGETELLLDPSGAAFIPQSRTLVIADVHLGKSATFRARGVPVPEGSTTEDLQKIHQLLEKYKASRLVIAGDFVHSSDALSEFVFTAIEECFDQLAIDIVLTKGNHDAKAMVTLLQGLGVEVCQHFQTDGLQITHFPDDLENHRYGIAGHMHPGIKVSENRKRGLDLKGFYLRSSNHLILPAFSAFTGNHYISPNPGDRFIAIASGKLYELPL